MSSFTLVSTATLEAVKSELKLAKRTAHKEARAAREAKGYGRCIGCHVALKRRVVARGFVQCQHCRSNGFAYFHHTHKAA